MDDSTIQIKFNQSLQDLSNWLARWKQIYAIVRKKTYTLAETEQLAAIFSCQVVRIRTTSRYNLVKNGQILFTGTLAQIVEYCFNNLLET